MDIAQEESVVRKLIMTVCKRDEKILDKRYNGTKSCLISHQYYSLIMNVILWISLH